MPEKTLSESEARLIQAIEDSPEFFIEEILGEKLDEQQRAVCRAFKTHDRVAVKSGHSCGKDFLGPRLGLWYWITHFPAIVITTGPTDRQVQQIVWGELRTAIRKSKFPIGGNLMPAASRLSDPEEPKHYMLGFTANDPSAFQGYHEKNVLVIVTEAQGINPLMWPGIESLMTAPNAKLLLLGNAIYEPGSEFYEVFTRKADHYACITLDSEKSSHCSAERIQEWKEIYGEDSPYYLARVKGIFPTDASDGLIPLGWITRAQERFQASDAARQSRDWHEDPEPLIRTLGVDVARYGTDHTIFYEGRGNRFTCAIDRRGQNLMETAGSIAGFISGGIPAPHVRVDDTGLGGGVTDRLQEQGFRVTAMNFGGKAQDDLHFANAKTEGYFNLRERFRTGTIEIDPADVVLVRDLSVIKMKQLSNGQDKIEDKSEQRRKLGYSPDRADALMLAALPQGLALDLETGAIPSRGLLEYYEGASGKKAPKPVNVRSVLEIPGAASIVAQETRGSEGGTVR
jgi:hypothetical protein